MQPTVNTIPTGSINIELPESGEHTQYKLSHIVQDPKAA